MFTIILYPGKKIPKLIKYGQFGLIMLIPIGILAKIVKMLFPETGYWIDVPFILLFLLVFGALIRGWVANPTCLKGEIFLIKHAEIEIHPLLRKVLAGVFLLCSIGILLIIPVIVKEIGYIWGISLSYISIVLFSFLFYLSAFYTINKNDLVTTYINTFLGIYALALLPVLWPVLLYFRFKKKY